MHSTDVDNFVNSLLEFSPLLMEGDYSGYDTSMPFDIGLAAATVTYDVLERLGYNDDALEVVRGLLSDNLFPTFVLDNDVITAPGFQPSGKYATAEDNSLRGLILLVYAFVDLVVFPHGFELNIHTDDFFKYVLPRIYGDDLLAAVKPEVQHLYNNVTYQKYCEDVYGMGFTNALKTQEVKPFLTIQEASFLKRHFVWREDLQHWVAQLDRKSIMKSIVHYLPSKVVSVEEQLTDACVSALRELFFYLSRDEFQARRERFVQVVCEVFGTPRDEALAVFPVWEVILDQVYPPEPLVTPMDLE
jgi:hypothetical protein